MDTIPQFWIVWSPGGTKPPSYRHDSMSSAIDEAKRLAGQNPGKEFYVLWAMGRARKVDVEWTPVDQSEIPF